MLEYQKIVLLFTAVSMFGATFPLGFALAFIISASALKIDRFKFIYTYRRPTPQGAQNIGSWSELLQIMSYVSIFVNITVMTFTSGTVEAVVVQLFGRTDSESAGYEDARFTIYSFLIIGMIFVKMAV